jgi:hypothetical protein
MKGSAMQTDTQGETETVLRRLEQILRELRIHNEREERREQAASAAAAEVRRRFASL